MSNKENMNAWRLCNFCECAYRYGYPLYCDFNCYRRAYRPGHEGDGEKLPRIE